MGPTHIPNNTELTDTANQRRGWERIVARARRTARYRELSKRGERRPERDKEVATREQRGRVHRWVG